MKYIVLSSLLILMTASGAIAAEGAKGKEAPPAAAPPGKMIGAAPIGDLLGKPPPKPPAKPPVKPGEAAPETGEQAAITPVAPVPVTPGDYELYLKSGHRDKSWDEWIKPAFDSFDKESYATAAIFLKQAYEKGCRDPMVLFRLGIYKESRGEAKEAAEMLSEAAKDAKRRYPTHPLTNAIHRHAGRSLYKVDDFKGAAPHLEEALSYEPNDFMLLLMSGQIARMEGKKKEARTLFERALAAPMPAGVTPDPKSTVLGELIVITYDEKDYDACEKYISQALKHDPKDKIAMKYRGLVGKARFRQRELEIIKKITE